jgi:glutamyl/glutaminyl-tRNA synthetase
MAELTVLEEKVAEVIGLAMAAQGATEKVERLTDDEELAQQLARMREEARETEERGTAYVEDLDGKKTAVLEKARETKGEATEMMSTYLGDDADDLDGFEFLTMAEAGELGHWAVLRQLIERAGDQRLQELVEWALPIQERHFEEVKAGSLKLAAEEDPGEPA